MEGKPNCHWCHGTGLFKRGPYSTLCPHCELLLVGPDVREPTPAPPPPPPRRRKRNPPPVPPGLFE